MRRFLTLLFLLIAAPLCAQEDVVLGLSQDRVRITASFDGSEILVFGAVKRESPISDVPLDVIVTLAGPAASPAIVASMPASRCGLVPRRSPARIDSVSCNCCDSAPSKARLDAG